MKQLRRSKLMLGLVAATAILVMVVTPAFAAGPQVRVVHASPDAPAVDVWVDGKPAFQNAAFKAITPYAALTAGEHKVQVVPAGKTEPAVISATLTLADNKDYTVVALGKLANIEPLVLEDNNSAPAAGKAHVRFVHASPDAPAVDIAVKGGPVVFSNVAFKGVGNYTPADAGTYTFEVRPTGTNTVALEVPGVKLEDGAVYTIFAMGLLTGEPKLVAVPSVDRAPNATAGAAAASAAPAPNQLPTTGGETSLLAAALLGALALFVAGGGLRRLARRTADRS